MRSEPITTVNVIRHEGGAETQFDDSIATEEPLLLKVEGRPVAVIMRTPGHDEELALGFLFSENVIGSMRDVFDVAVCPSIEANERGNVVDVTLRRPDHVSWESLTRHVFTSSSCGICGKTSIDDVLKHRGQRVEIVPSIEDAIFHQAAETLREAQKNFASTGGIHASGLFSRSGELLLCREDVGRHNALDKLIGAALAKGLLPLKNSFLLLSGRISFELMQKAQAAGIPIVAGISAPSSLAVEFARQSGQRLVGFLRPGRLNQYS